MEVRDNNACFVCGAKNDRGLKLIFKKEGNEAYVEFIPPSYLQGYEKILHGGIISTLLDEVMVKAIGKKVLTMELEVKFLKPVMIGSEVIFRGRLDNLIKKIAFASSEVKNKDGNTLAVAKGKYFCLDA